MRLLVIGASGFIGRYILSLAKERGYLVLGTQFSAGRADLIKFNLLTDRIADIIPKSFFETNEQICGVICSAISKIDQCWINREQSYKINVINTIRLLNDFKRLGIRAVFLSSEQVYDGKRGYYDESIPPSPVNEYGRQKAEIESYINSNLPRDIVLRLSMIIGDDPAEKHLLAQWYSWVLDNKPITCIEGQVFSPTYVKDVAKGTIEALNKNLNGLYNLTNPEFFAREELARQFLITLNKDKEINIVIKPQEEFGFPERRSLKSYLDGSKFNKTIGMCFTPVKEIFSAFISNAGWKIKWDARKYY